VSQHRNAAHESVLLLSPSGGLGGGIERYVSTIEAAFQEHEVRYRRLNLIDRDRPHGIATKVRFVQEVRRAMRASTGPTRLVIGLCNLLPVLRVVAGSPNFTGATVTVYGDDIWAGRQVRGHRAMRRPDVRVVAISNFAAGALARTCHANVLHPGVPASWYKALVNAATTARRTPGELNLVTAFRLSAWRHKGLETILDAVRLLGDDRVRLTVCGSGSVSPDLQAAVAPYPWCRIRPNLTDHMLAQQMAEADLFVLASRVRPGISECGEGFGLVLLEAQLAGTPVVAPAYGGSVEAFQPDVTGLAPLDETPQALATVLASLLRDDRRRAEMGRAAAAWSRVRFEPVAHSRQLLQAYLDDTVRTPEQSPAGTSLHGAS
jgi:glycosyltransferase involved in cell wall biosynthesis